MSSTAVVMTSPRYLETVHEPCPERISLRPVSDIIPRTEAWITGDPDPESRRELEALIAEARLDELADRMAGTLEFGTAGLRGRVEAGSNRMNRAVVIRATRGLADHILATSDEARGPVVVGRDARLSSPRFLGDVVGVLVAAGLPVRFVDRPCPTPVIAYLAKSFGAVAAVVVTASHNPPADNGYKVYASNAVQIVPPEDRLISDAIAEVGPACDVPRVEAWSAHPLASPVTDGEIEGYVDAVLDAVPDVAADRDLEIVYSAMHGVGGSTVEKVLSRAGFRHLHTVPAQFEPDGRFPTVSFPNPEEPGAMDLSTTLALEVGADLVIANDPDADRLAVGLPEPRGGFRQLTGNQIGVVLADFLLEHTHLDRPIVIESIVSSPMLASVASAHGARWERTLTGFKWICNAARDLEEAGEGNFVFGYEEALGYSVGRTVRDKDGISAALAFAVMAGASAVAGESVWDRLGRLYRRHGLWVSTQKSVVRQGAAGAGEIAAAMRLLSERRPEALAGMAVTAVTDYREGAGGRPRWLAATPLVELALGEHGRALIRPSGTEPKIKIYVDLRSEAGDDWMADERELLAHAGRVAEALAEFAGL
jgi:phosphomannomutase